MGGCILHSPAQQNFNCKFQCGMKKWSPLFNLGAQSPILGHLKMGPKINKEGQNILDDKTYSCMHVSFDKTSISVTYSVLCVHEKLKTTCLYCSAGWLCHCATKRTECSCDGRCPGGSLCYPHPLRYHDSCS